MRNEPFYRNVFRVAALWEFVTGGGALIFQNAIGDAYALDRPVPALLFQSLSATAVIFGLAYWAVSRDLGRNRMVVYMGIYQKVVIFLLTIRAVARFGIGLSALVVPTMDLVFVGLFISFLRAFR